MVKQTDGAEAAKPDVSFNAASGPSELEQSGVHVARPNFKASQRTEFVPAVGRETEQNPNDEFGNGLSISFTRR